MGRVVGMGLVGLALVMGGACGRTGLTGTSGGSGEGGGSGEDGATQGGSDSGDDGPTSGGSGPVEPAACGDGAIGGDERCDDGNTIDNDGCDGDCEPSAVIGVVTGESHTCALTRTGAVRCWGAATPGTLGYGAADGCLSPCSSGPTCCVGDDDVPASAGDVDVGGVVVQLTAGDRHNCAILATGGVRCWGANLSGELGYGHTDAIGDDEVPASAGDVDLGGTAVELSAGSAHTCALLDGGRVRCWGTGAQLGYGNTETIGDDEVPASAGDVDVGGVVVQIVAGRRHTCALLEVGTVRCWGTGPYGELGYASTEAVGDDEVPASKGDVDVGGTVVELAAGRSHTCALVEDGNLRCWGGGESWLHYGQLGYPGTQNVGDDETPASVGDVDVGAPVTHVAGGHFHTCALLDAGQVRCWGRGEFGMLGNMSRESIGDDEVPATAGIVALGGAVAALSVGGGHTCALLDTGALRCWGHAAWGELGYGNTNVVGDDELPETAGNVPVF